MPVHVSGDALRSGEIAAVRHAGARVRRWGAYALAQVLGWVERARQRRQLGTLDDRLLKDIGVTRREVERELARPFWRP